MAKLCVMCVSLCACFLIFFTTAAATKPNEYDYYETDFRDDKLEYDFTTHEGDHRLQRRDAQIESNQSNSNSSTSTLAGPNNATVQNPKQASGPIAGIPAFNKTLTDNKISTTKTKLGKVSKGPSSPNVTKLPLDIFPKNLGVNGTGQRKNVTIKQVLLPNDTAARIPLFENFTLPTKHELDPNFPPDEDDKAFKETLADHNITNTTHDNHIYYNSTIHTDPAVGQQFWVNLDNFGDTKVNDLLSKSHRRAATIQLKFDFPFYGHKIKNVTIATGGFLYTGDYVHSWLAATQYIAPLMANFDTSISNESFVRYLDNGTAFTVEWEKVALQDKANEGQFTFQTTLHQNGDIVFVYKSVPLFITNITDEHHPVKVGLSDAYIIDRTVFLVRRKTIYEYHRVNFFKEDIKNGTVIYLTALPTCLQSEDCVACVTKDIQPFECYWCPSLKRCSNGVDRHRQEWLTNRCQNKELNESACSHISGADIFDDTNITYLHDVNEFQNRLEGPSHPVKMGVSSIVAILFLIAMVAGLAVWVLYAYRNPHTTSGQILIRYRPSQWRWRRGEARYTAATIHM